MCVSGFFYFLHHLIANIYYSEHKISTCKYNVVVFLFGWNNFLLFYVAFETGKNTRYRKIFQYVVHTERHLWGHVILF